MQTSEVIKHVLELLAGVGTFMVACEIMSSNLQALSSQKLKSLFAKVSNNKIIGVCIGAVTTALIQSSGATTVMTIGFVNAKIITLNQAATIILGGEIGTTLTGQIVALGMFNGGSSISMNTIFAAFIGIGAFVDIFARKDHAKKIGGILVGFGMIFVGLSMMSSSMDAFAKLDSLKVFLASIKSTVLLIVVGAIITAIIQSSSAMTSIAITMIVAGLISLEQGIYITLGANVGTCLTGALAAMSSGTSAKRTSLFQLMFNLGGVLLIAVVDAVIKLSNSYSIATLFESLFPGIPQTQLAMFHTFFNISTVIIALPICTYMVDLTTVIIKSTNKPKAKKRLKYFDEKMLSTPSIAVGQIKNEIINMASIAMNNFDIAIDIITNLNFERKQEFEENEEELNYLNQYLVQIVSILSTKNIDDNDYKYLTTTYRAISDFERIGDYSENIIEYATVLNDANMSFSKSAIKEINEVRDVIDELYSISMNIYSRFDKKAFKKASELEEKVDELTESMAGNHILRMNAGECSAEIGAQYLQLSSDMERIADHLININDKDFVISH